MSFVQDVIPGIWEVRVIIIIWLLLKGRKKSWSRQLRNPEMQDRSFRPLFPPVSFDPVASCLQFWESTIKKWKTCLGSQDFRNDLRWTAFLRDQYDLMTRDGVFREGGGYSFSSWKFRGGVLNLRPKFRRGSIKTKTEFFGAVYQNQVDNFDQWF